MKIDSAVLVDQSLSYASAPRSSSGSLIKQTGHWQIGPGNPTMYRNAPRKIRKYARVHRLCTPFSPPFAVVHPLFSVRCRCHREDAHKTGAASVSPAALRHILLPYHPLRPSTSSHSTRDIKARAISGGGC